jgi:hypothetical protein
MEWEPPSEIPINQSMMFLKKAKRVCHLYFLDLALRLDDREGHPTVRGFIPNLFLSQRQQRN